MGEYRNVVQNGTVGYCYDTVRIETTRYRNDISFYVDNSTGMFIELHIYVFKWKSFIYHEFVPVNTNNQWAISSDRNHGALQ